MIPSRRRMYSISSFPYIPLEADGHILSRNTSVIVSKLSITRESATCTHALLLFEVPRFGFGEPELLNGLSTSPPFMQLLSSLSAHSISFHANHLTNVAVAISWVFPPSARSARWPPTTVPRMPKLRSSPALLDRDCYIFTRLECAGSPHTAQPFFISMTCWTYH